MTRPRRLARLACLACLVCLVARSASADERWPVWPTEIDRITERAFDVGGAAEGERAAAFLRLHAYATPVIRDVVIQALDDPSLQIRKEALDLCALRSLRGCIPAATRAWDTAADPGERVKALEVIALDPTDARALVLFAALKDPDERMRRSAVQLIASAPFPADGVDEARSRLLAKLTDSAAQVRADAANGLASLGGDKASLAVVRLLADPDPSVREAAAITLGRFADPRTRASLLRAIERGGTPSFVREATNALASIPGQDVDAQLLALFDEPPDASLSRNYVAEAIGRRRDPSDPLVDGLIQRLRVETLHADALRALQRLGDGAVARLERARARGLEPSLAVEVEDLLRARALPTVARREIPPLPGAEDRAGWHARLARIDDAMADGALSPGGTDHAALALAQLHPKWLAAAIASAVERAGRPRDARPWLLALAVVAEPALDDRGHAWVWMRLATWATDDGASDEDRCLALSALGAAAQTRHRKRVVEQLLSVARTRAPLVRACAGMTLGRLQAEDPLGPLLRDPVAEVRAGAALGAANLRQASEELTSTLAAQSTRDAANQARGGAAWALARLGQGPGPAAFVSASSPRTWHDLPGWLTLRGPGGETLSVPVVGPNGPPPPSDGDGSQGPGRRWMLVPGLNGYRVEDPPPFVEEGMGPPLR